MIVSATAGTVRPGLSNASHRDHRMLETEMTPSNAALYKRACGVIPGGVNSPVRAFLRVGGTPYFVTRGAGPYVWDAEGNRYTDYVQSWGASILGHAHPKVVQAVQRAAELGTSFGAPTEAEIALAEAIRVTVPSCERVRLVSSGTEATMSAVRVARAFTGRDGVIMFEGCYHGHSDSLLASGGSGIATLGIPASRGVPASAVANTIVATYNQVPLVEDHIACVIVEPVAANMGLVLPQPGFLEGLREACDRAGALLVFDEVITGFRMGLGGAQHFYGVIPDLTCMGKVIGGGLPLAAFGGRADVMSMLAPEGPVYQAGTLSGNPVATAAALAVLEELTEDVYQQLVANTEFLATTLSQALTSSGLEAQVVTIGTLLGVFFSASAPRNYEDVRATDGARFARFFHEMLKRGVALPPSPFEALFPSVAHSREDIEKTCLAAQDAALSVQSTTVDPVS